MKTKRSAPPERRRGRLSILIKELNILKRILATLVAVTVVFGALPLYSGAATPGQGTTPRPTPTYTFNDGAMVLDDSKIEDFGNIILGNKPENILEIVINYDAFNGASDWSDIDADTVNDLMLVFSDGDTEALFPIIHKQAWKPDQVAKYVLQAQDIGTAKGTLWVQSYKYGTKSAEVPINGNFIDPTINSVIDHITDRPIPANGTFLNMVDIGEESLKDMGRVYAGSDLAFKLDTDHFKWIPDLEEMYGSVRKSTLDTNRVRTSVMYRKGKECIESIGYENFDGRAYLVVRFKEDFPFTDEREFAFDLYMTHKGKRKEETMLQVSGWVVNDIITIRGDNERADLSPGGLMVEAEGACRNAELYIGAGVSIYQNLVGGNLYYARGTDKRSDGDIEIMNYFPDIKKVLSVTTARGISNSAKVRLRYFERDDMGNEIVEQFQTKYFVYDADGKLLGNTDDELPVRDKYYLALQELDFGETDFQDVQEAMDSDVREWGNNSNGNPNTGAGFAYTGTREED